MLKFSANLSFLFTELPFLDRFEAAARAGFKAVEYMFPYAYDSDEICRCLDEHGLQQVLFNLPVDNWEAGERGIACHPGRESEFRAGAVLAVQLAKKMDVRHLNCLAGIKPATLGDDDCREVMLSNLQYAADLAAAEGIKLMIEPINSRIDMPGFWLDTPQKAMVLIKALGHRNLFLQYDVYHAHVMGNSVLTDLSLLQAHIAHIQIADHPGRHQPGSGEIPYAELFQWLQNNAYSSWVGCEYRPLGSTTDSLVWMYSRMSE